MLTIDIGYFFMIKEMGVSKAMLIKEEIFNPIKNLTEGIVNEIGR